MRKGHRRGYFRFIGSPIYLRGSSQVKSISSSAGEVLGPMSVGGVNNGGVVRVDVLFLPVFCLWFLVCCLLWFFGGGCFVSGFKFGVHCLHFVIAGVDGQ